MQLHTVIDDKLIQEARRVTGLESEQKLLEYALRALIHLQQLSGKIPPDFIAVPAMPEEKPAKNPIAALLELDLIGCAEADPKLSQNYKTELTKSLRKKYGYR